MYIYRVMKNLWIGCMLCCAFFSACKNEDKPKEKVDLMTKAKDYLLAKNKDSALIIINEFLASGVKSSEAQTIKAQLLFEQNNLAETASVLSEATGIYPENLDLKLMQSAVLLFGKDTSIACDQLADIIKSYDERIAKEGSTSRNKKNLRISKAMAEKLINRSDEISKLAKEFKDDKLINNILQQNAGQIIQQIMIRK